MNKINFIQYKNPKNFLEIYKKQISLLELRKNNQISDTCLLLEHNDVYTSGKNTSEEDVYNNKIKIIKTDRGGKITWHGIGQIIVYPIFKFEELNLSLYNFILTFSKTIIESIKDAGYPYTVFVREYPGIWTFSGKKIASMGIRVSSGVTMHGMAINCNNSLNAFQQIKPCGIDNIVMTSISSELGKIIDKEFLYKKLMENIVNYFNFNKATLYYED